MNNTSVILFALIDWLLRFSKPTNGTPQHALLSARPRLSWLELTEAFHHQRAFFVRNVTGLRPILSTAIYQYHLPCVVCVRYIILAVGSLHR